MTGIEAAPSPSHPKSRTAPAIGASRLQEVTRRDSALRFRGPKVSGSIASQCRSEMASRGLVCLEPPQVDVESNRRSDIWACHVWTPSDCAVRESSADAHARGTRRITDGRRKKERQAAEYFNPF